jgi:glycopeptide antibiotics resistance protein
VAKKWGIVLLVLSLLAVAAATLVPTPDSGSQRFMWGLVRNPKHLIEGGLNAALFLPLGVSGRLLGFSARRTLAMAAALSLAIEMLQLFVIPGRYGELQDLIANVIGAGVGWLFLDLMRAAYPRRNDY